MIESIKYYSDRLCNTIATYWRWLTQKHDYEMKFVEGTLYSYYECTHCGHRASGSHDALRNMTLGRKCRHDKSFKMIRAIRNGEREAAS
jgi:hypothetical protein